MHARLGLIEMGGLDRIGFGADTRKFKFFFLHFALCMQD